jgi:hypothetical protein
MEKQKYTSVKKIYAMGILRVLIFDMQQQLNDGVNAKVIYDSAMKRLGRLKNSKYYKIIWDKEKPYQNGK